MSTKTEICNMAVSHIGVGKPIADIDTDRSNEATVCNRFYTTVRDMMLRDVQWPFATAFVDLGTATEDPTTEWAYSYVLPTDCLLARRIPNGDRNTTPWLNEPFRVVSDAEADGSLIYTDVEDADLEYTKRITDESYFMPDFVLAFSLRLAIEIAPRLTAGDTSALVQALYQRYNLEVSRAAANAMNEQVKSKTPDAEMILARE